MTATRLDRACGAVLGTAIGDALGAPYEFGLASVGPTGPQMIGGGLGPFAPGEWTDDTTMAWAILEVAASGACLRTDHALTRIARNFRTWYDSAPPDIGNQTRSILDRAGPNPTGVDMQAVSADQHARTGHTAGNGSLMRTAPVALPYLDDPAGLVEAARKVGALTHYDPHAQEACLLWSFAIRHAILDGELDVGAGLAYLERGAAEYWVERIAEAEAGPPQRFRPNGWVVAALQAAWSAIVHTPVPTAGPICRHLAEALVTAVGIGDDTDTVAAIAGGLLGARYGASAIPSRWRRISHGYPGLRGEDLIKLAYLAANKGPAEDGWPDVDRIEYALNRTCRVLVAHPHDAGVWLAGASALDNFPDQVTALLSLCPLGREQLPVGLEHISYEFIDRPDHAANPNLDFILADAAQTIAMLRSEGHQVLILGASAGSQTHAVGVAYSLSLGYDLGTATEQVGGALPQGVETSRFLDALSRLADTGC